MKQAMKQVTFQTQEDAIKGYSVLLHKGTVVYTDKKGTYIVPEESIEALKGKSIKFKVIESVRK
jgi:hypothetical protein